MCGRFASSRPVEDLLVHFEIADEPDADERPGADAAGAHAAATGAAGGADSVEEPLPPSWNVAPTDPVRVVLQRHGRRRLQIARWGLVPSWAKDRKGAARLINARRETLADRPAFRSAYERRRCLVPADGYYEWQVLGDAGATGRGGGIRKRPWYLTSADGAPLAMAGLYEVWRGGDGPALWTCTVVTTDAADDTGQIHDRTPLLVPREDWARWLDPELPDPGSDLLVPGTPGRLRAWPVAPGVGNVRADGPELTLPVHG